MSIIYAISYHFFLFSFFFMFCGSLVHACVCLLFPAVLFCFILSGHSPIVQKSTINAHGPDLSAFFLRAVRSAASSPTSFSVPPKAGPPPHLRYRKKSAHRRWFRMLQRSEPNFCTSRKSTPTGGTFFLKAKDKKKEGDAYAGLLPFPFLSAACRRRGIRDRNRRTFRRVPVPYNICCARGRTYIPCPQPSDSRFCRPADATL